MRVGHNPHKNADAPRLKALVLAVVTHLPNLDGYHSQRLEVVQTCIRSMIRNVGRDHSLIVWDNGSCDLLTEWIEYEMQPDILVKSINVGKTTARTAIFRMVHPRSVVAYADDDMYFYPNWFDPQYALLQHFPNVACVTGYPVRTSFRWGIDNTLRWARDHGKLEKGRFLPQRWEDDFADSIGRDREAHVDGSRNDIDYRVTYKGVQAYCTSHHCQFVARAETIDKLLQYDGMAMGDEKPFDIALDRVGLRLATTERYTRHIGNVIHDELKKEIEKAEIATA